ncbi:hypothetical protein V6N12_049868 [Hibiscus sabdariffa]|uniref:Uncharacterized protein n=1 Tax=Hibiscus sabdariffa TaxID=183260 RepID=A0ABR2GAS9_9ROSI
MYESERVALKEGELDSIRRLLVTLLQTDQLENVENHGDVRAALVVLPTPVLLQSNTWGPSTKDPTLLVHALLHFLSYSQMRSESPSTCIDQKPKSIAKMTDLSHAMAFAMKASAKHECG